ncbi:MAG: ATP-binding protein [Pseudomonadota bacterium]
MNKDIARKAAETMDISKRNASLLENSPALILLVIALSVVAAEASVMLLLNYLPPLSMLQEALADAAMLVVLISPALYLFLFRPMVAQLRRRTRDARELQESLGELRSLKFALDRHAIVSITDAKGQIVYVNDKFCKASKYRREELLGQNHRILKSGMHEDGLYIDMWRTISAGNVWQGELCNRSKDGEHYWVETTIVPLLDEQGLPRQYIAIRTDITRLLSVTAALADSKAELELRVRDRTAELEQAKQALEADIKAMKQLNQKLEDAHSQLLQSEKMASIGQLAAGVAHEINNPIGYVYSNLGTLERYVQDTFGMLELYEQAEGALTDPAVLARLQTARQKLDIAFLKTDLRAMMAESKDGITRVKNIVQNLKDFSHADSTDEWRYADLHRGLDSTLSIVNNEIKYKAEVVRKYGELPQVECLASQLNQVFMNLLVNAAHAIEERGTITVSTGRQGDEVWVEVADTGKGIAPEHLKKLFDPFFTTKPVGQGTGLGLSLSYGIVQKHHGRIEVQSELGKGTAFRVWLPVEQTPSRPA